MVIEKVSDVIKAGIGTVTTDEERGIVLSAASQNPSLQIQLSTGEVLINVDPIRFSQDFQGQLPDGTTVLRSRSQIEAFGQFAPIEQPPQLDLPSQAIPGASVFAEQTLEEQQRRLAAIEAGGFQVTRQVTAPVPTKPTPTAPSLTQELGERVVTALTPEEIDELRISQTREQIILQQQTEATPVFSGTGGNTTPLSSQGKIIMEIERQERFAASGIQPPPLPTPTPGVRVDPADDAKDLNLVDDTVDIVREGLGEVPGNLGGLVEAIDDRFGDVIETVSSGVQAIPAELVGLGRQAQQGIELAVESIPGAPETAEVIQEGLAEIPERLGELATTVRPGIGKAIEAVPLGPETLSVVKSGVSQAVGLIEEGFEKALAATGPQTKVVQTSEIVDIDGNLTNVTTNETIILPTELDPFSVTKRVIGGAVGVVTLPFLLRNLASGQVSTEDLQTSIIEEATFDPVGFTLGLVGGALVLGTPGKNILVTKSGKFPKISVSAGVAEAVTLPEQVGVRAGAVKAKFVVDIGGKKFGVDSQGTVVSTKDFTGITSAEGRSFIQVISEAGKIKTGTLVTQIKGVKVQQPIDNADILFTRGVLESGGISKVTAARVITRKGIDSEVLKSLGEADQAIINRILGPTVGGKIGRITTTFAKIETGAKTLKADELAKKVDRGVGEFKIEGFEITDEVAPLVRDIGDTPTKPPSKIKAKPDEFLDEGIIISDESQLSKTMTLKQIVEASEKQARLTRIEKAKKLEAAQKLIEDPPPVIEGETPSKILRQTDGVVIDDSFFAADVAAQRSAGVDIAKEIFRAEGGLVKTVRKTTPTELRPEVSITGGLDFDISLDTPLGSEDEIISTDFPTTAKVTSRVDKSLTPKSIPSLGIDKFDDVDDILGNLDPIGLPRVNGRQSLSLRQAQEINTGLKQQQVQRQRQIQEDQLEQLVDTGTEILLDEGTGLKLRQATPTRLDTPTRTKLKTPTPGRPRFPTEIITDITIPFFPIIPTRPIPRRKKKKVILRKEKKVKRRVTPSLAGAVLGVKQQFGEDFIFTGQELRGT